MKQDVKERNRDVEEGPVSLGRSRGKAAGSTQGQSRTGLQVCIMQIQGRATGQGAAGCLSCQVHGCRGQEGGWWDGKKAAEAPQKGRATQGFDQGGAEGTQGHQLERCFRGGSTGQHVHSFIHSFIHSFTRHFSYSSSN